MVEVVETIYATNIRDTAGTLRKIADDMEAGKFGKSVEMALVVQGDGKRFDVFGAGPEQDGSTTILLLALAHMRMIQGTLALIEQQGEES